MEEREEYLAMRQQKQQFLRAEIIGKGYNPEHFTELCEQQKPGSGANIDAWEFSELQSIVEQFQKLEELSKAALQEFDENSNIKEQEQNQPVGLTLLKKHIEYEYPEMTDDNNFSKTISCKQLEETTMSKCLKKIRIRIIDYEIKSGGLFSPKYALFKIITQPFGWVVYRRFSDFYWLKQSLDRLHTY